MVLVDTLQKYAQESHVTAKLNKQNHPKGHGNQTKQMTFFAPTKGGPSWDAGKNSETGGRKRANRDRKPDSSNSAEQALKLALREGQ